MNKAYVYIYFDPRRQGVYQYGPYIFGYEPFYVGKGRNRRWQSHLKIANYSWKNKRNPTHFINRIRLLGRCGLQPIVLKYATNLSDEDALTLETNMISQIEREKYGGPLLNLGPGGEGGRRDVNLSGINNGFYGKTHTEKVRLNISRAASKRNYEIAKKGKNHFQILETNPSYLASVSGTHWMTEKWEGLNNPSYKQEKVKKIISWLQKIEATVEINSDVVASIGYADLSGFIKATRKYIAIFSLPLQLTYTKNITDRRKRTWLVTPI